MGKQKNLNGLPNSLVQKYFSTTFFYNKAYMADWIWNAANDKGINELTINIMKGSVSPNELQIKPITIYLPRLCDTIFTTLRSEKFDLDFIESGKFDIFISSKFKSLKLLTCKATLKDKNVKTYVSQTYTEKSFENTFTVFKPSIVERIKKLLN